MINYELNSKINNVKNEKDAMKTLMQHSFESFVYSIRTGEFNYAIAKELGYSKAECEMYFLCGMFHDVGKIGMPKFLIDYPGSYNEAMRNEMKQHTLGGGMLLEKINANSMLSETAKFHHCNYDGTGYVYNLKGEEIPFHARITRISDSADAYLSTRSYKKGYEVKGLFDDLKKYEGTWYDPKILVALERVHNKVIKEMPTESSMVTQDNYMNTMKKVYDFEIVSANHFFEIAKHNSTESEE